MFCKISEDLLKNRCSHCMKNATPSLRFCSSETYPPFPLGPKPPPKAPSERNVFRLLGANFAVQLLMKPPSEARAPTPEGERRPWPRRGGEQKKVVAAKFVPRSRKTFLSEGAIRQLNDAGRAIFGSWGPQTLGLPQASLKKIYLRLAFRQPPL